MAIADFFDTQVVISRHRSLGGRKKAFQTTATADGHIQDLDDSARQAMGIIEGRYWKAWFSVGSPIQEGDIITDQGTDVRYEVHEISSKNYAFGTNVHKEVILKEYNE